MECFFIIDKSIGYFNKFLVTVPEAIQDDIIPRIIIVVTTITILLHSKETG